MKNIMNNMSYPLILLIVITLLNGTNSQTIKFKGDWMLQDHYEMKTGERIYFDFNAINNIYSNNNSNKNENAKENQNNNKNNIQQNKNKIYDMQIIDNNEKDDKRYSKLCQVKHMRIQPQLSQSITLYSTQNSHDNSQQFINDFIVINNHIIAYITSNGNITIANLTLTYNNNNNVNVNETNNNNQNQNNSSSNINNRLDYGDDEHDDNYRINVQNIYQDKLTQIDNNMDIKLLYHQEYQSLILYISNGQVYSFDISNYINNNHTQDQSNVDNKENKKNEQPQFYQIENIPQYERIRKLIIQNNHMIYLTQNNKISIIKLKRDNNINIIQKQEIINDINNDNDYNYMDIEYYNNTLILLDKTKGIIFYDYNKENDEYILNSYINIPIIGGIMIQQQQLQTIIVATSNKTIHEYFIDYHNNSELLHSHQEQFYIQNNIISLDEQINTITIENDYLFISCQGRNNNFIMPINLLKNTIYNIDDHQTMISFGTHYINLKFIMLSINQQQQQVQQQQSQQQQKIKRLKGQNHQHHLQQNQEQTNEEQNINNNNKQQNNIKKLMIQLIDGNKIEIVPYIKEKELLICSSESTSKILSNVNEKYSYTILYNSTQCLEKLRYFQSQNGHNNNNNNNNSLDIRKSYCNTHATITFEIDFTQYEKEEFVIWIIFITIFILTAIISFRHYKNKKLQQMFALKERMSTEQNTQKRKRINLHYEPLSLLPNKTYSNSSIDSSILKED